MERVLRSACQRDSSEDLKPDPRELHPSLVEYAEHRLFKLGAIAPAVVVGQRALSSLTEMEGAQELSGEALVQHWGAHLDARIQQFVEDPREWDEPAIEEFMEQCALVFGVEDDHAGALLGHFHRMPESQRFAIFVKLMRSSLFGYLLREIRAMPPGEDMDIDDPQESLRHLLRTQAASTC